MEFNDYQSFTDSTAVFDKESGLWYTALGLAGEAGEYCDKIKKIIRDGSGQISEERRKALIKELGDVLWYTAQAARVLGVELEEVADTNIKKLTKRMEDNTVRGDGDNR